jgi:hypothetical protein
MSGLRPTLYLAATFFALILLLAACRDDNAPFAQNDRALIACSEECAARGQCGTTDDGRRVVLANSAGPAVSQHDTLYTDETQVVIAGLIERELIAARNGAPLIAEATPFPHTFYQVTDQEGRSAWVSGWCLARP